MQVVLAHRHLLALLIFQSYSSTYNNLLQLHDQLLDREAFLQVILAHKNLLTLLFFHTTVAASSILESRHDCSCCAGDEDIRKSKQTVARTKGKGKKVIPAKNTARRARPAKEGVRAGNSRQLRSKVREVKKRGDMVSKSKCLPYLPVVNRNK